MSLEPFTDRELRDAFSRFATGVTVVTTQGPGGPLGITANSFASVSLDPPLVLWQPARASSRFTPFTACERFAIHVMGAGQHAISQHFVRESGMPNDAAWSEAEDGTPLLDDCLARFHCETYAVHDAGDHAIVIGRVLDAQHREGEPLIFAGGRYGVFAEH